MSDLEDGRRERPALRAALGAAGRALVDVVLPPRCLLCGAVVDRQGLLCPRCWPEIAFIGPPLCACCGLPFAFETPEATRCGACEADPPEFDRARAVLVYDEASRVLLTRFKYADATYAAPSFAAWMARAGAELVAECDLIAPVPLHRWRLLRRKYNQAALLASALGRQTNRQVAVDLLTRSRHTPPQVGLSPLARARNVRAAFELRRRWAGQVEGRRILLVDDVLTMGATVRECARVLRRAGASGVDIVTVARVARSG